MLFDFLKQNNECRHSSIPIDVDEAYCPDCGALVKNKWFIVRCSCCNIKRTSHTRYGEIIPDTKFCPNCGETDFYIQEVDKINFTDVNYAILKKVVINQSKSAASQVWIEKEENLIKERKLLGIMK